MADAIEQNAPPTQTATNQAVDKRKELFNQLKAKRAEAKVLNYNEVKEEDKKNQIDPKAEFKKQKEIQEGKELLYRKELEEKGLEYERVKALEVTIDEANKKNKEIQKKIRNANNGFASFEDSSLRKYKRQVNNLKPNLDEYNEKKQETEEDPELNANTYGLSTPVAESKIDALIEDLNKQSQKRQEFSRRRKWDEHADVDYINERNMKFNQKISRAFDAYTKEIKDNLDRGTAI